MKRGEIEAVLNGMWFREEMQAGDVTYAITACVRYEASCDAAPNILSSLMGVSGSTPEQGGKLSASLTVWALGARGWQEIGASNLPPQVLRRMADIKQAFLDWAKDEGPWPRGSSR